MGRHAVAVPTDVADPDQFEAAAERIEDELGPIAVWVNNAMTSVFAPNVVSAWWPGRDAPPLGSSAVGGCPVDRPCR